MNQFLSYLNDLQHLTSHHANSNISVPTTINQAAFIETFPQHFDSIDGTYKNWQTIRTSDSLKEITSKPTNSWDTAHLLYHCKPNDQNINLIEKSIAQSIINTNYHYNNKIGFIEVFKYFNKFPRMHYGYCREDVRTVLLDCSHLCSFNPTMWMPIWAQLLYSG